MQHEALVRQSTAGSHKHALLEHSKKGDSPFSNTASERLQVCTPGIPTRDEMKLATLQARPQRNTQGLQGSIYSSSNSYGDDFLHGERMRSKTLSAEHTKGNMLLRKQASAEGFDAADFALGLAGAGSGDSANAGSRVGPMADPLAGAVVSGGAVLSSENGRSVNRGAIRIEESSSVAAEAGTPALRVFKKRGKEIVLKKANIQRHEGVKRVQLMEGGAAGLMGSPDEKRAEEDFMRQNKKKNSNVRRSCLIRLG